MSAESGGPSSDPEQAPARPAGRAPASGQSRRVGRQRADLLRVCRWWPRRAWRAQPLHPRPDRRRSLPPKLAARGRLSPSAQRGVVPQDSLASVAVPPPFSQVDGAAAKLDHIAAHPHLTLRIHAQAQGRRPADVLALRDVELAGKRPVHCEAPAAEVRRRRAGGRILQYRAPLREEEAREERRPGRRKHVHHAATVDALELLQKIGTHPHPAHRRLALQRHDELLRAGIDPQRAVADIHFVEPEHRREHESWLRHLAPSRGVGLQRPAVPHGAHRNDAGRHLERDPVTPEAERPADVCRAERRVSGEGHLVGGRKDPHPCAGPLRGQDEGGLRQVELQRKRLHPLGVERLRPLEHAQRIAAECRARLGKDVDDAIRVRWHYLDSSRTRRRSQP